MKKFILFFIILLAAVVAAAFYFMQPAVVVVVHPTRGTAVLAVYATGTIEAGVMLPIAPRISAKLTQFNADEGSVVHKGQILARLEDNDLQSTLQQLRAQQNLAQAVYARKSLLLQSGTITKADYDTAKAAWQSAQALSAKAATEVGFMQLTAPNDGTIIKRDGEIGQLMPAQQPIFWLMCCAPLRIAAEVNEEDIHQVRVGQKVLIRADAFAEQVFDGTVQAITPKGDPIARTYRVRVAFAGNVPLKIGMTAETNIIIQQHTNALLVPLGAVVAHKLWLVQNNTLVQQTITQGITGQTSQQILSGLRDTDVVVAQPSAALVAGARVRTHLQPR